MSKETIDFIAGGQGSGVVANQLLAQGQMNPNAMRPFVGNDGRPYITVFKGGDVTNPANYGVQLVNNAVLRRDEWKQLDDAVMSVSETRLNGINDLISRNLTYNLGNAMGTTVLESHDLSDAMEAELSMDGVTRGKSDRPDYGTRYLPIPIIHVDYEINARVLAASRNMGNPLDTTSAERAARKVAERLERMLFSAVTYSFGGGTIYSYVNHPDRNPLTLSKAWNAADKTGAEIITDVLAMKQKSIDNLHYGPWVIYIPTAYEVVLDRDYDTSKSGTVRERILKIAGIQDIKVNDILATNNVVMVQMTSDVVRLVRGLPIQNLQWKSEGDFVNNFKVLTIQVPQIRSDYNKKSGIVHLA